MFRRALESMRSLPTGLLTLHIIAKFLFGMGLGMLLVDHYGFDGNTYGLVLIVVAVVVAIPSTIRILSGLGGS